MDHEEIKCSMFSIIPTSLFLDVNVSKTTVMLYGLISSHLNYKGECSKANNYFADLLRCSVRTIEIGMSSLLNRGYIERSEDNRRIKLPTKNITYIQKPQKADDAYKEDAELVEWMNAFITRWENGVSITKSLKKEAYYPMILERLNIYSKAELDKALDNRIKFVTESEWHNEPENKRHKTNLLILLREDKEVLKYLEYENETVQSKAKNLKRDTVKFEMDNKKNLLD